MSTRRYCFRAMTRKAAPASREAAFVVPMQGAILDGLLLLSTP